MSTTPATTPRPAATSTHKRKRNITAHSILEEMEARGYTPVSPETDALWNKCKSKARRVLNHPEADVDDLKDHWKTVSKLVCAKTDAKEAAEKHKAIEKKLKGKLQESKDQLHNFENLMQIGDWAAGLQNIVKGAESEVVHEFVEDLKRKFKASGLSTDDAATEAQKYRSFTVVHGFQATEILARVQPELDQIRQWRADGERRGHEPSTPCLDRIGAICLHVGIDRALYLSLLRIYDERNRTAHHPPPFDEYIDSDGKMDWYEVRKACKTHRRRARRHFKKGKISEAQLDLFLETIDTWLRVQVSYPRRGKPIPTAQGKKAVTKAHKGARPAVMVPDSPWTKGKWDDIE
ncbi:hypothetical protein BHE90_015301 [Fusarium euwallaceae]|uniref:Uncharacterized protein n=2 Tax=Fusarium solani species complex TaxID=232080 RepID=A0A3M2RHX1_9HYPO|nr:hypothetical protein CDV36_014429 [Fusarium kuroshium]RTE70305.1 hypothetical protein BHE90_015301 [Fusarium euwallaceae]